MVASLRFELLARSNEAAAIFSRLSTPIPISHNNEQNAQNFRLHAYSTRASQSTALPNILRLHSASRRIAGSSLPVPHLKRPINKTPIFNMATAIAGPSINTEPDPGPPPPPYTVSQQHVLVLIITLIIAAFVLVPICWLAQNIFLPCIRGHFVARANRRRRRLRQLAEGMPDGETAEMV